MMKTYRLKNLLMAGQTDGAKLETMLGSPEWLGAFYDLRHNARWMRDIAQSPLAMGVLAGSRTAVAEGYALDSCRTILEASPTALRALAGSAEAMLTVRDNAQAMDLILGSDARSSFVGSLAAVQAAAVSTTAMTRVADSAATMALIAASEPALEAIISTTAGRNALAGSSSAVEIMAVSAAAMSVLVRSLPTMKKMFSLQMPLTEIFKSAAGREAVWGSATALQALGESSLLNTNLGSWLSAQDGGTAASYSTYLNSWIGNSSQYANKKLIVYAISSNMAGPKVRFSGTGGGSGTEPYEHDFTATGYQYVVKAHTGLLVDSYEGSNATMGAYFILV